MSKLEKVLKGSVLIEAIRAAENAEVVCVMETDDAIDAYCADAEQHPPKLKIATSYSRQLVLFTARKELERVYEETKQLRLERERLIYIASRALARGSSQNRHELQHLLRNIIERRVDEH